MGDSDLHHHHVLPHGGGGSFPASRKQNGVGLRKGGVCLVAARQLGSILVYLQYSGFCISLTFIDSDFGFRLVHLQSNGVCMFNTLNPDTRPQTSKYLSEASLPNFFVASCWTFNM